MKLDLFYEIDVPRPWPGEFPENQRRAEQESYDEALEQIQLADKLGFNTIWLVEHHFREGRSHCSAPEVVHGALSQLTKNIRLGFGVCLMPHGFTPPVRVAEKVATVDVLSKGRVEWGTGRSTPMEQTAFGVDREKSRAMAEDAIKSVVHFWENEYAEWHSEFYDFPKRLVCPKPYQDPHPAPRMAATSDGSAEIAGRQGMGLLSFAIMQPLSRMQKQIEQYRAAAANPEPITRVANNRVAAYTLVHLMDDNKEAEEHRVWDSVWWWYQNLAEFTLEWEFPHFGQEQKDAYFPFLKKNAEGNFDPRDFNKQDMIIVGTPDECMKKIQHYADIGVDQLLCYVQFGFLPHKSVMRTIELLGKEIIPALEKQGHETRATVTAK
ncbi:MAG: LLM class flavin-dependent oxidoreductase [Acidimicrobiia bacterium]|nr:LLM class flavin-dependent oxidoreductase [Acidimicrobiia bacterium]